MPKIIENVRERILEEAKKQVMELGYSSMTIRSVAGALGIATGTLYNYFPSKQMMVAGFMAEDWMHTIFDIKTKCLNSDDYKFILQTVYDGVTEYSNAHKTLFDDPEAQTGFAGAYMGKRGILIGQVAEIFEPICKSDAANYTPHTSEFLAESLMNWVTAHRDLEELYIITKSLFK